MRVMLLPVEVVSVTSNFLLTFFFYLNQASLEVRTRTTQQEMSAHYLIKKLNGELAFNSN